VRHRSLRFRSRPATCAGFSRKVGEEAGAPGVPLAPALRRVRGLLPHFTGTAEELLECYRSLQETLGVGILKHAAKVLRTQHLQGLFAISLGPENILLEGFP